MPVCPITFANPFRIALWGTNILLCVPRFVFRFDGYQVLALCLLVFTTVFALFLLSFSSIFFIIGFGLLLSFLILFVVVFIVYFLIVLKLLCSGAPLYLLLNCMDFLRCCCFCLYNTCVFVCMYYKSLWPMLSSLLLSPHDDLEHASLKNDPARFIIAVTTGYMQLYVCTYVCMYSIIWAYKVFSIGFLQDMWFF